MLVNEPILYDPITKKSMFQSIHERKNSFLSALVSTQRIKPNQMLNQAPPGSLLKVWSGKLNLQPTRQANPMVQSKPHLIQVEMFSTMDI